MTRVCYIWINVFLICDASKPIRKIAGPHTKVFVEQIPFFFLLGVYHICYPLESSRYMHEGKEVKRWAISYISTIHCSSHPEESSWGQWDVEPQQKNQIRLRNWDNRCVAQDSILKAWLKVQPKRRVVCKNQW